MRAYWAVRGVAGMYRVYDIKALWSTGTGNQLLLATFPLVRAAMERKRYELIKRYFRVTDKAIIADKKQHDPDPDVSKTFFAASLKPIETYQKPILLQTVNNQN